jgi:hypothetical protein
VRLMKDPLSWAVDSRPLNFGAGFCYFVLIHGSHLPEGALFLCTSGHNRLGKERRINREGRVMGSCDRGGTYFASNQGAWRMAQSPRSKPADNENRNSGTPIMGDAHR